MLSSQEPHCKQAHNTSFPMLQNLVSTANNNTIKFISIGNDEIIKWSQILDRRGDLMRKHKQMQRSIQICLHIHESQFQKAGACICL